LLLLDEPTEGIQPNVVQQIEAALHRVRRELGVTVMIVELYLDFSPGLSAGPLLRHARWAHCGVQGYTATESAADGGAAGLYLTMGNW
jgi:urea transport system ATP-binding protein